MSYVIAVTNPAGWTRFVGRLVWWVDATERALSFDTEQEANEHVNNPHTMAGERKRAGWSVEVKPGEAVMRAGI